ncbi:MAG: hypothetical protein IIY89_06855 [Clostridia bacterium]|nr:hypothetical protein [Clostridia bacterium]
MANSVKKHGFHLPFEMTRRRMILIALTVTVLVTLTIAVPLLIKRYREEMWEYSGAKTDRSVQLLYDMDHMGDFSVVSDKLQADGRYSEHIVVEKAIDVRLWRNFERPKLPCREQIMEKYPDLSGYSQQKAPEDALYCQRGSFTVKDGDGTAYSHTVVLLRRGGWDYLVDLSVRNESRDMYQDQIDEIIDRMILLP